MENTAFASSPISHMPAPGGHLWTTLAQHYLVRLSAALAMSLVMSADELEIGHRMHIFGGCGQIPEVGVKHG